MDKPRAMPGPDKNTLTVPAYLGRHVAIKEDAPLLESSVADHATELPLRKTTPRRASLVVRLATLVTITVPLLGVIAALVSLWGRGFDWTDLGLLLGMYVLTALGITVGFHRLLVHRSFETYMWVKFVLAVLGSMAIENPLFKWVAMHRRHHQVSDTPDDPHSPQHGGRGVLGLLRGFWHAHIGWFFGGHEVGVAYDGAAALVAATEFRPGVMIVDIMMPELDGAALARRVRMLPELAGVVLIAMTGRQERLSGEPFDHWLLKPADPVVLQGLLSLVAERRQV